MWKQQIKQRLDASVEEILGIFEQAVAEYKHELSSLKADVQQMMLINEEELRTDVDRQDPEHLSIKEEQEEPWTCLEGEQLSGKEETETTKFPFASVPLKSETDEGRPQFSQLHHQDRALPATDGEDCVLHTDEDDFNSSETEVSEDYQDGDNSDSQLKLLSGAEDTDWKTSWASESDVNKSFSCSECGKRFVHRRSLQKHVTTHSVTRVSSCFNNEKNYRARKTLDSCREDQTSPKLFRYDDRGEKFTMKTNLNGHLKIYMEQKPFVCDICEQRFKSKANLSRHTRTHTGQKPFGCDVCGQKFRDDTNLDRHMRSHTGEKPFICDVCGRGFKDKSTLGRHMRIHTGQKPFGCYVCGRSFSQKTHLNRHMSIHTRPSVL